MEVELFFGENKVYKDGEILTEFIKDLKLLIDEYQFSIGTVSILCNIELEKLHEFYYGKGCLSYEEMVLIHDVVLMPFLGAVNTAKDNYNVLKSCRNTKPMGFDE